MNWVKAMEANGAQQATPEQRLRARRIGLALAGVAVLGAIAVVAPGAWWLAGEASASAPTAGQAAGRTIGTGAQVQPQPGTPYDLSWQVVSSPNPSSTINGLHGVAVASANDVWAVGYYAGASGYQTLIEHWNGMVWSVVPGPNPSSTINELYGVSVASTNDVWAVGYDSNGSGYQTLVEHWNGTAWSVVPSPSPGSSESELNSVAVSSPTDAWAVGFSSNGSGNQTLVEHWNGTVWSVVPSLSPGSTDNALNSVAVSSANDVWAVGSYSSFVGGAQSQTLVEHWNGTAWLVVPSPSPGPAPQNNYLAGVAVASATDVWAVGYYTTASSGNQTLVELWNGTVWSVVPSPSPSSYGNGLLSVSVESASDIWAVGVRSAANASEQTLTEHWNGTVWSAVSSPSPGPSGNGLFGVAAVSPTDVWDVGGFLLSNGTQQTLVERYSSAPAPTSTPTHGSATATPRRTSTPSGATATRTPTHPIGATATPTTCRGFTDVPPGSTFYPFVTCLVGRGIVSGYPDCSFHVNSNVTRGQLSKIVSLAANFTDPPGNQIFQDVAPLSTFYDYVQRLANRNIIGGYACGGAGESCVPPANRPYFRPNNAVTRGQTSKIVAIAAGLPAPPSSQQTFQDVPHNSTFWQWIEELSTAGAINGYACGGGLPPGSEPCVPPENRPYFRPGATVTRGQSSKIITNTFFPNCQGLVKDIGITP